MQANRRRDTKPERQLRSVLHRLGLRYRVDLLIRIGGLRVRPDIVFTRQKVAVFIDGCFWHCCPEHGREPAVNSWYWSPKLEGNRLRDLRNTAALQAEGWRVLRVWEHVAVGEAAALVTQTLRQL